MSHITTSTGRAKTIITQYFQRVIRMQHLQAHRIILSCTIMKHDIALI